MRQQLPTIAAGLLAAFLILSPALAGAATVYTLTVGTSATQYTGIGSSSITGSVSPAPGTGTAVQLTITNPSSVLVWSDAVAVSPTTGAYSDTFGSSSSWVSGTYTVTASWGQAAASTPITATSTFVYAASGSTTTPPSSTSSAVQPFTVRVIAPGQAYPGEAVAIFIETTYNGSLIGGNSSSMTFGAHMWTVSSGKSTTPAITLLPAPTNFATGHWVTTWTVPANASMGQVQWVHVPATCNTGACKGWHTTGVAGITIVPSQVLDGSLATTSQVNALTAAVNSFNAFTKNITSLSSSLSSLSNTVSTLNSNLNTLTQQIQSDTTAVNGLQTTLNSIQASIVSINTRITALQSSVNGMTSAVSGLSTVQPSVSTLNTSVGNSQTYILVVAALAVITLVLELAILIRKMS